MDQDGNTDAASGETPHVLSRIQLSSSRYILMSARALATPLASCSNMAEARIWDSNEWASREVQEGPCPQEGAISVPHCCLRQHRIDPTCITRHRRAIFWFAAHDHCYVPLRWSRVHGVRDAQVIPFRPKQSSQSYRASSQHSGASPLRPHSGAGYRVTHPVSRALQAALRDLSWGEGGDVGASRAGSGCGCGWPGVGSSSRCGQAAYADAGHTHNLHNLPSLLAPTAAASPSPPPPHPSTLSLLAS